MRGFAALLFSGLVAFTATATAQPNGGWRDQDGRWHDRDRDDHDRYDHDRYDHDRYDRRGYNVDRNQWMPLATAVLGESTSVRITINRPLHSIELQAIRGGADITTIGIGYHDGTQEPIKVDAPLDARHSPNMRFDLPHGGVGVEAIVVEGRGRVRFRVIGS